MKELVRVVRVPVSIKSPLIYRQFIFPWELQTEETRFPQEKAFTAR